jgi:hypothetical protein
MSRRSRKTSIGTKRVFVLLRRAIQRVAIVYALVGGVYEKV